MKRAILLLLILLTLVACKPKVQEDTDHYITLRLKPEMKVNISVEINNSQTEISIQELEASWNDIRMQNKAGDYTIYFWNSRHYVDEIKFKVNNIGEDQIIHKEISLRKKKAELNLQLIGSITDNPEISIGAKNGSLQYPFLCIYRSVGFLKAQPLEDAALCQETWRNETPSGNLTDGKQLCGYLLKGCGSVKGNKCIEPVEPIPAEVKADKCYFLGETITDSEKIIPLETKVISYYDEGDYLLLTLGDRDRYAQNRIISGEWGYDYSALWSAEIR